MLHGSTPYVFSFNADGDAVDLKAAVGRDENIFMPVDYAGLDKVAVFGVQRYLDLAGDKLQLLAVHYIGRAQLRILAKLPVYILAEMLSGFGGHTAVFKDVAKLFTGNCERLRILALLVGCDTVAQLLVYRLDNIIAQGLVTAVAENAGKGIPLLSGRHGNLSLENRIYKVLMYFANIS